MRKYLKYQKKNLSWLETKQKVLLKPDKFRKNLSWLERQRLYSDILGKKLKRKIRRIQKCYNDRVEFVKNRRNEEYAEEKTRHRGFLQRRKKDVRMDVETSTETKRKKPVATDERGNDA